MCKQIFLDNLPHGGKGLSDKYINWKVSIGYKVKFIYDDICGEIEIIDYWRENKEGFLKFKYNNNIFKMRSNNFKKFALDNKIFKTNKPESKIGQTFNDKNRNITIISEEYRKDNKGHNIEWYKYKCNKCGYKDWIRKGNLLKGHGCVACCNSSKIITSGINDIPTTAPWMIKYFQGGYDEAKLYSKGSNEKKYFKCPDCGRIKTKKQYIYYVYKYKSIGCSCGDGFSYPNKLMYLFLEKLNIKFIAEYKPEWCIYELNNKKKTGRYDFYFELNGQGYIIEMDGGWHNNDNKISGQTKEETKQIDNIKDKLAREYDIEVIRIDCDYGNNDRFKYIKKSILNSKKLNNIFDLNKINWLIIEENILSNLVKKTCEIKRDNPDITTTDIGKIMNLNRSIVKNYLKKGTELGWCNYDPKKEKSKASRKNGKNNGKLVGIFKDNIFLGKFFNCAELERQSENLFGKKLDRVTISLFCRRKYPCKTYKGFTFQYI